MNRGGQGNRGAKGKKGAQSPPRPAEGPLERAQGMLLRLETSGPNPVNAAEELDRLQGKLERDGELDPIRERVADLCDAWASTQLRGDRARAWLVLVGGFNLKEYLPDVAELARNTGLPAALRVPACHVLAHLGGEEATGALQEVLLARTDAQVRVAAAEALALLGDRSVRPVLEALLDEDLPQNVWSAVSHARDRLW